VTWERPQDRDVAMVFQNYALYPFLNVEDNIGFPLKMAGVAKDERRRRVREAAELLELEMLLERKPGQLSGGQRQRVAMGRAIVREPSAFLMDEPLSNLDALLRGQMRAEIAQLQGRLGVTTVYVTHDQVEAMTMGTRVAVLRDGRLQQCAPPRVLYESPANAFVAGFIGSPPMNFLACKVETPGRLRLPGGTEITYDPQSAAAQPGASVLAGLRPEAVTLVGPNGTASALRLKIELIEELGMGRLVHGLVDGSAFTVAQGASDPPPQGEAFAIEVAPASVHLFDAESGMRL
jgi:ABC-type sugar transport system ATPase subunit